MTGLLDISVPITEDLVTWNDGGKPRLERTADLARGDPVTATRLILGAHTGTHVDAPAHFLAGGATMAAMDLAILLGPARVVDLTAVTAIGIADLAPRVPAGTVRLLLKTSNSRLWADPAHRFVRDYLAPDRATAQWLVDRGVRLLGIDYLSAAPFIDTSGVHRILLGAGMILLEGLDLRAAAAGEYELICLPLHLPTCEAAPCRAVLRPLPAPTTP
jgi:arylformamidase